jgi:hypothetical protein
MGFEVKKNDNNEYQLICTISDESYHPEKEWISEDECKKILIEQAFWKFVEKTLEIDSCFPNAYYINGKKDFSKNDRSDFLRWWLDNAYGENSDEIITKKFEEISNRLKLDIKI